MAEPNVECFEDVVPKCGAGSPRGVAMDREIRTVNQELLEKQYYFNATRDSLTQHSRQSAVARRVDTLNMQELSNPPFTIKPKSGKH